MGKQEINIVWFKRDLRLSDNEAIKNSLKGGNPVLFLYIFENFLINDSHYSERHWSFVKESIVDINKTLSFNNSKVLAVSGDAFEVLDSIQSKYTIKRICSHQETGIQVTYQRDKAMKNYLEKAKIEWVENVNNGVFRGLLNRQNWFEKWEEYMHSPIVHTDLRSINMLNLSQIEELEKNLKTADLSTEKNNNFQKGGTNTGWRYANSFLQERHKNYMFHISKPQASRTSCSRISPYLA